LYIDSSRALLIYPAYGNSIVMAESDKNKKSAINVEEKCDIDEEIPVEQPVEIANAKNAMTTLISADGKNHDNTGELFFTSVSYRCVIVFIKTR